MYIFCYLTSCRGWWFNLPKVWLILLLRLEWSMLLCSLAWNLGDGRRLICLGICAILFLFSIFELKSYRLRFWKLEDIKGCLAISFFVGFFVNFWLLVLCSLVDQIANKKKMFSKWLLSYILNQNQKVEWLFSLTFDFSLTFL